MCNGFIDFKKIAQAHDYTEAEFMEITKFDPSKLDDMVQDNLVEITGSTLRVTETGMLIVRNVAVAFDPDFVAAANKYSNTI
jgi:coproporphyrinogen III oxidase-like Fe-S oxidoreductase